VRRGLPEKLGYDVPEDPFLKGLFMKAVFKAY
jgi:hypothetical protein